MNIMELKKFQVTEIKNLHIDDVFYCLRDNKKRLRVVTAINRDTRMPEHSNIVSVEWIGEYDNSDGDCIFSEKVVYLRNLKIKE